MPKLESSWSCVFCHLSFLPWAPESCALLENQNFMTSGDVFSWEVLRNCYEIIFVKVRQNPPRKYTFAKVFHTPPRKCTNFVKVFHTPSRECILFLWCYHVNPHKNKLCPSWKKFKMKNTEIVGLSLFNLELKPVYSISLS